MNSLCEPDSQELPLSGSPFITNRPNRLTVTTHVTYEETFVTPFVANVTCLKKCVTHLNHKHA